MYVTYCFINQLKLYRGGIYFNIQDESKFLMDFLLYDKHSKIGTIIIKPLLRNLRTGEWELNIDIICQQGVLLSESLKVDIKKETKIISFELLEKIGGDAFND